VSIRRSKHWLVIALNSISANPKKSGGHLRANRRPVMVYQFMQEHQNEYRIREMTKVFGVSGSAYYRWAQQGVSAKRSKRDAELLELIREMARQHHFRYGSPRVRETLRQDYGKPVSLKKVAQLMQENGLNARRRRKCIPTTNWNQGLPVCENRLNREFQAATAGTKWVSDITYLRTLDGWIYLTVVLDLYDRKVIGWAFSSDMETVHTTLPALPMAFTHRSAREGLLFHSDRESQYRSKSFCDALSAYFPTVRQSMSRKGNCWDNACAESFFKTLKRELETVDGKHSALEVRQAVFMYLEAYYNRLRLHLALDYVAPNMFNPGWVA
jgi:transposase InsO family protein